MLRLRATRVRGLEPLRGLTGLRVLDVAHTPVADLEPISTLTGLTELHLAGSAVTDLAPLAGLTRLTELSVDGLPITSLAALTGLPWFAAARRVDLGGTGLSRPPGSNGRRARPSCSSTTRESAMSLRWPGCAGFKCSGWTTPRSTTSDRSPR